MVFNHVTEQHPLPLVSLFQKLLEECSSRNRDFGPAQRQTLQASALLLSGFMLYSCFTPSAVAAALAFLEGLLVVCVLSNFLAPSTKI